MNSIRRVFNLFLDLLFPAVCLTCLRYLKDSSELICEKCLGSIELNTSFFEGANGRRLPNNVRRGYPQGSFLLAAASSYNDIFVKDLIWKLKFEGKTAGAKVLALILNRYISGLNYDFSNFSLLPIPLHRSRRRRRGFNQSQQIAKELSDLSAMPILSGALHRIKNTKAQSELSDFSQRKENLRQAFQVFEPELVVGKKILLLDDVYTSGATLKEAIRELRLAGAKQVVALVAAKA